MRLINMWECVHVSLQAETAPESAQDQRCRDTRHLTRHRRETRRINLFKSIAHPRIRYICLAFAIVYHLSLLSLSLSLIVFLHITDRITGFRITTVLPNANHVSSFMFQSSSISAYCTILYRRRRKLSALQIKPLPRCTLKHQNRGVASCCGPYRRPL